MACVEQLRHGSKARTTASTRLSMPSVSLVAVDKMLGDLQYPTVERQIVVARGDNHVGPDHQSVFVHLVVVDQRAAWSFRHSDAFGVVGTGKGADVFGQNVWPCSNCSMRSMP